MESGIFREQLLQKAADHHLSDARTSKSRRIQADRSRQGLNPGAILQEEPKKSRTGRLFLEWK